MRSAIWSTLVCTAGPPSGRWGGRRRRVMRGEHRNEAGEGFREEALRKRLLGCVGQLLADDSGEKDRPVARHLIDRGIGADPLAPPHLAEHVVRAGE